MAPKAQKRDADGKPKEKYTTGQVKSQCVEYFNEMATKKKATDAEKQEAKVAYQMFLGRVGDQA